MASKKSPQEENADLLIVQAVAAYEIGNLSQSLDLYREAMSIYMTIYKAEPKDSIRKKELLAMIEGNMKEAERIKAEITRNSTAVPPAAPLVSGPPVPAAPAPAPSSANTLVPPAPPIQRTTSGNIPSSTPLSSTGRSNSNTRSTQATGSSTTSATNSSNNNNETIPSIFSPAKSKNTSSTKPPASAKKSSEVDILPDHYDYTANNKSNSSKRTLPASKPLGGTPIDSSSASTARKPAVPTQARRPSKTDQGGAPAAATNTASTAGSSSGKGNEYTAQIMDEILDKSPEVKWDDIAGLSFAKQTLQEAVILPNLRPDLFTGLRAPPKGVLLFGPPGTGKTLLAKAVATESGFVFFSISASSVTSKYLGEGEKLIKALFEIAREKQPAVIFIDEIDSLMSARKDNEHEASRRLKTEFMTQLDGAASASSDRILVMGATNLPWDIDEAVLRRLPKRIYVPLPDNESRKALISHLLKKQGPSASHLLQDRELTRIVQLTDGYSGSDLAALCQEAALGPIRELNPQALRTIKVEEIRSISVQDFQNALRVIRPSVSQDSLQNFVKWSDQFGVTR